MNTYTIAFALALGAAAAARAGGEPKPEASVAERFAELKAGTYGDFDEIVYATRSYQLNEHWYGNFGYYAESPRLTAYGHWGSLRAHNIKTGDERVLLRDDEGCVRDPCVSFDGRQILFSYRPALDEHFHLYVIDADGENFRQLTFGGYDDIEPTWLPDGGIAFVSARARRWVNCWLLQVGTVYRMNADGSGIQCLSANIEHDNTPWPLPDGRLLYTRWEYVDRRQVTFHHLWTMNPDGFQHQTVLGNEAPNGVFIDAKPVPGAPGKIVFALSWGHGDTEHRAAMAMADLRRGPDSTDQIRVVPNCIGYDPWAFSEDLIMFSRGDDVVLANGKGEQLTLFRRPDGLYGEPKGVNVFAFEPRPLMARDRGHVLPRRAKNDEPTGRFLLADVNAARKGQGLRPGLVKKLMVLETLPKPINFTGGMDPMSYAGTFTLPRILGTVPVEEDGSAYFEAPALRPLFFVALDAEGRAVKRMQSFTQVMGGEFQSCTGCHERRTYNPPNVSGATVAAARRAPSQIDASDRAFDVPDFPRHVQPVLDRACAKCHNPRVRSGGVDLSGDRGPMFSMGYYNLVAFRQVLDGRNEETSDYPAYARGSGGSPLVKKLLGGHHGAKATPGELKTVMNWLDASAPYPGTYAALGTGMIGGYERNHEVINNDAGRASVLKARPFIRARCQTCHTGARRLPEYVADENGISFWTPSMDDPRLTSTSRHYVFNLTRPELSLYLLAPLAKEAGGLGLCADAEGRPVFASKDDPAYAAIREMIEDAARVLDAVKRFDMPGFTARPEYIREMKRYGVLAPGWDPAAPLDYYELDRRYWDLPRAVLNGN